MVGDHYCPFAAGEFLEFFKVLKPGILSGFCVRKKYVVIPQVGGVPFKTWNHYKFTVAVILVYELDKVGPPILCNFETVQPFFFASSNPLSRRPMWESRS
jgi:hypothetical protein